MDYVGKHTFSGPMLKQLAHEALQHTQFRKPYETDTTTEPSRCTQSCQNGLSRVRTDLLFAFLRSLLPLYR